MFQILIRVALLVGALLLVVPFPAAHADMDCDDFTSRADVQESVDDGDPNGLDYDGDGRGCEWNDYGDEDGGVPQWLVVSLVGLLAVGGIALAARRDSLVIFFASVLLIPAVVVLGIVDVGGETGDDRPPSGPPQGDDPNDAPACSSRFDC